MTMHEGANHKNGRHVLKFKWPVLFQPKNRRWLKEGREILMQNLYMKKSVSVLGWEAEEQRIHSFVEGI